MNPWQTISDKTGVSIEGTMMELIAGEHMKPSELYKFVNECKDKNECAVCGTSLGYYRLINPEESFVDSICDICYDKIKGRE